MSHDARYFDQLLDQAKNGMMLRESDLALVQKELRSPESSVDPYTLLHIVGRANDVAAVDVVREYLRFGIDDPLDDGMVRRIAVQILGRWWHIKEAFPIARDMAFDDPSPFVRAIAATSLGELGKTHPELEQEAARALLRGIQGYGTEQKDVWASFYIGMLELVGVDPRQWPVRPDELKPSDLDPRVMDRVQRIADS